MHVVVMLQVGATIVQLEAAIDTHVDGDYQEPTDGCAARNSNT